MLDRAHTRPKTQRASDPKKAREEDDGGGGCGVHPSKPPCGLAPLDCHQHAHTHTNSIPHPFGSSILARACGCGCLRALWRQTHTDSPEPSLNVPSSLGRDSNNAQANKGKAPPPPPHHNPPHTATHQRTVDSMLVVMVQVPWLPFVKTLNRFESSSHSKFARRATRQNCWGTPPTHTE
jgi:hypothetical protein